MCSYDDSLRALATEQEEEKRRKNDVVRRYAHSGNSLSRFSLRESDRLESQVRRVAHKVHRRWDLTQHPACGLVDNPRLAGTSSYATAVHEALHGVAVLVISLRMRSNLRMLATKATLKGLPSSRRRE